MKLFNTMNAEIELINLMGQVREALAIWIQKNSKNNEYAAPRITEQTDNDLRNMARNEIIDNAKKAMSRAPDPSPARRMWKLWAIMNMYGNPHMTYRDNGNDDSMTPVTILTGHSAVEEIEREAYWRGHCDGFKHELDLDAERPRAIPTIDGVSPVVVDGWTMPHLVANPWHSVERNLHVYEYDYGEYTPCRVAMWPGIGPDGKLVNS